MNGPDQKPLLPHYLKNEVFKDRGMTNEEIKETEYIWSTSSTFKYPETDVERHLSRFLQSTGNAMHVSKRPAKFAMFRWAAAAIILLGVSVGLYQYLSLKADTYTAELSSSGNIKTIHLPDGSTMSLNKGTTIFVKAINKNKRILELEKGEIFISVKHSSVPFRVITSHGAVTVLGTEFTIKDKPGEAFSVCLQKGKIKFESNGESAILNAGEQLSEDPEGAFIVSKTNNTVATAWLDGRLRFNNALVSDVVQTLEKTYEIQFVYDQSINNERITASFDNLTAEQAALLLSKTLNKPFGVK